MSHAARFLFVLALTLLPAAAFAQAAPGLTPEASATLRVACFSPQRAFAESAVGKEAIARLRSLQTEKARVVDERTKALEAQEQAFERSSPLLTEAARTEKSKEIEPFRVDVQRFIEDAQAELMGVQREAETAFVI
jgi:Skp family chaperone for outer membrane proteins